MCCREMPEQVLGCGRMQAPGEEAGTTDLLIPTGPHTCPGLDTLHGTLIIISLCIPKPLSPSLPRRRRPLAVLTGEEGSELSFPQCSFITQPHSHRGEGTSLRSQGCFIPCSVEMRVSKCFHLLARWSCLCGADIVAIPQGIFLPSLSLSFLLFR